MMERSILLLSDFVFLYPLFMSFVWIIGSLIFYFRNERNKKLVPQLDVYPLFSIVVPCHNEEKQIKGTIQNLLKLDYPHYEIVAIDDGSTDATAKILHELSEQHGRVRAVYIRENGGKGAALNTGCLVANGELLMTLDADAFLDKDALRWMAWHFVKFPRVGAVTGNPRVLNRTSLIARIQIGEYASIIGMVKRTQRILGKILTVSGVVAAFRRQAVISSGMWSSDMITEDIDITWKLEKRSWDIRYEPKAVCWILVPETIKGLWRQRLRWAQGGIEVLLRHIDIWQSWRQRRLWPVYIEYVVTVFWVYIFWALALMWLLSAISGTDLLPIKIPPPIPPRWTGALLALVCLMQFGVSMYMDNVYEKKFFRYIFWVIWYPFIYWMINALTVVVAAPRALLKRKGKKAVWKSPDRGL